MLALVLDLDGTLLDSLPDIHAAMTSALAAWDRPPVPIAALRAMLGDGAPVLAGRALAATGGHLPPEQEAAFARHFMRTYDANSTATTQPFPGVVETLALLKGQGHRLGVCTNKPHAPSLVMVQTLGLAPFFDAVLGGDALANCKPHPDHLWATVRAMGAQGWPAVMVGDTRPDAEVARRADVPFVLAAYGYARPQDGELAADAVIASFAELPGVLEGLVWR
ncbi:MAG: phosphoglycolate phosphatase [Pseudomonadota bacterium]